MMQTGAGEILSGMIAPDVPLSAVAPEQARIVAISQTYAAMADANEPVQEIRRYLPGRKVLAPSEVTRWIDGTSYQEGRATSYVVNLPWEAFEAHKNQEGEYDGSYILPQVWVEALVFGRPVAVPAIAKDKIVPVVDTWGLPGERAALQPKMLWYVAPEWGERIPHKPVRPGGILDELRRLALLLAHDYSVWGQDTNRDPRDQQYWGLARAATYVLTGYAPLIDERLYPLRRGKGARAQSIKHLQLAVFTMRGGERTLADRMAEWNDRFPDWAYKQPTTFGWDSREALRRLIPERNPVSAAAPRARRTYTDEEINIAITEKSLQVGSDGVDVNQSDPAGRAEIAQLLKDARTRAKDFTAGQIVSAIEEKRRQTGRRGAVWGSEVDHLLKDANMRAEADQAEKDIG